MRLQIDFSRSKPDSPAPTPDASVEPAAGQEAPGIPHREFLEKALGSAGDWTRFADPKALGVLVLLGLGVKDLIDHSGRFVHPREPATATCDPIDVAGHTCAGLGATLMFFAACVLAGAVVIFVTHALFSRTSLSDLLGRDEEDQAPKSRFFFGEISRYGSQEKYAAAVLERKEHELLRDIAGQVYEISRVCQGKHMATKRAYAALIAFLVAWAIARVLLGVM